MKSILRTFALAALLLPALAGCEKKPSAAPVPAVASPYEPQPYVKLEHPEWTRNATLYQINVRQFTPEGTLKAAATQLPRLKELGVDILWLMPLNPIGEQNRKGTLGSPYSVKDYRAVNPEFGSFEDVKALVDQAHGLGMRVILDWVANHSAWDNPLVRQHPDWYSRDHRGQYHSTSWFDWTDIIDFDYSRPALREYMIDSMKLWVEKTGIDGFRCDVAGFVPLDFWVAARRELEKVKPVFLLAEWEATDLHAEAFHMTYAWSWYEAMKVAAQGQVGALVGYYSQDDNAWPREAMRMTFTSNHDKNAWEGTEFEAFGPSVRNAIALSVVGSGMPLIYNGQEAGNTKRLEFFEKDPIEWREHPHGELFSRLFALKHANTALWNGKWGARMIPVPNDQPTTVLSFVRQNERDKVFAVFNFSPRPQGVRFAGEVQAGNYLDFDNGQAVSLRPDSVVAVAPWGYRVLVRSSPAPVPDPTPVTPSTTMGSPAPTSPAESAAVPGQ